jgi:hypothetical protein
MDPLVPLAVALTGGLPALGIAVWTARSENPQLRAGARRWALVALVILCGAAALYFAGGNRSAAIVVVAAMALAVNGLLLSLALHVRRSGRGDPGR